MDSPTPKEQPFLDKEMQDLNPDLSSLIKKLINEQESTKTVYSDRIEALENKLENFRGMITRRDEKILKLEAKIKRQK